MKTREIKEINWKLYLCCNHCWEFKEATPDNRQKNKRWILWFSTRCKKCMSEYAKNNKEKYRSYYYNNREKKLEYIKRYTEEHKEEIIKKRKQYYQDNKEEFAKKNKERYENNREMVLEQQKEYYTKNKEHIQEYKRNYRIKNIDKIKQHYAENREQRAENRKSNEHYKEYMRKYELEHKQEILDRKKKKRDEMWYWAMHIKTPRLIKKLWIRPKVCPICWEERRIEAHHPDNNVWYEIVFCCTQCHQRIHNWWIECPKPINLLGQ